METKLFEIRDVMTFIPVIATLIDSNTSDSQSGYLIRTTGYNTPTILLGRLDGGKLSYDPHQEIFSGSAEAHEYILNHWFDLNSGDVIDLEYIRGDTKVPKQSQRLDNYKT